MSVEGTGEAQMNIEGNGTGKGTIYFAYEKGLLVESAVELDMTMAIATPCQAEMEKFPPQLIRQ